MDARKFAGIIGTAVLLTAGSSNAGSAGRIESLDGTQGVTPSVNEPGSASERRPLSHGESYLPLGMPQGDASPRTTTPFGGPFPPNQLTPAPLLPFNPNRSLMPSASAPPPYSGSGRLGR
jgi:hypothetical protein